MTPSRWFEIVDSGHCDQCGLTASAIAPEQLAGAIKDAAGQWDEFLPNFRDHAALRCRPDALVWSALEYACHVRDTLQVFLQRAHLVLSTADPQFEYQDQDALVTSRQYNAQDPRAVSREIRQVAAEFAQLLSRTPRGTWGRSGTRLEGERFDLAGLARFALHEARHHLVDARASVDATSDD
jgi:DinB family protein